MENVFIDEFVVAQESEVEFLEGARKSQSFIRTPPSFLLVEAVSLHQQASHFQKQVSPQLGVFGYVEF